MQDASSIIAELPGTAPQRRQRHYLLAAGKRPEGCEAEIED
jgi:hypothetical protein